MAERTQKAPVEHLFFIVPMTPPSVNRVWRKKRGGGFFISPQAKAFYDAVGYIAQGRSVAGERYEVEAHIFLGHDRRGDVDNFGKCLLDSLQRAGVIRTDAKVDFVAIRKGRDAENPRTEISVWTAKRSEA